MNILSATEFPLKTILCFCSFFLSNNNSSSCFGFSLCHLQESLIILVANELLINNSFRWWLPYNSQNNLHLCQVTQNSNICKLPQSLCFVTVFTYYFFSWSITILVSRLLLTTVYTTGWLHAVFLILTTRIQQLLS